MVADRFTVGPGEKVVVVNGREKDFTPWMNQHPHIKECVIFMSDDDRRDSVPAGVKGVLFGKYVSHSDRSRLESIAHKHGVTFVRCFKNSGELKTFLEISVLVDSIPAVNISTIKTTLEEVVQTASPVLESRDQLQVSAIEGEKVAEKQKKGGVKEFVFSNANFQAVSVKEEAKRLFQLATSKNLQTTEASLSQALYVLRKELSSPATSKPSSKLKSREKKSDGAESVLAGFVPTIKTFMDSCEVTAVAVKEVLEKVASFETERKSWISEKTELEHKIQLLEKQNHKLQGDFKRKVAEFLKDMK